MKSMAGIMRYFCIIILIMQLQIQIAVKTIQILKVSLIKVQQKLEKYTG